MRDLFYQKSSDAIHTPPPPKKKLNKNQHNWNFNFKIFNPFKILNWLLYRDFCITNLVLVRNLCIGMISYWNTQCRVINYKICYYNTVFFSIYVIENNFKIIRSKLSSFIFFALPNDPTCYFDILDFLTTWMSIANQAHTSC